MPEPVYARATKPQPMTTPEQGVDWAAAEASDYVLVPAEELARLRAQVAAQGEVAEKAIGLADEMLSYVPEYFQQKWQFPEELSALRAGLDATTAAET